MQRGRNYLQFFAITSHLLCTAKECPNLSDISWDTQVADGDKDGKFSFCKNVDVPRNYLSLEYLLFAYDVTQSTFKRLRARGGEALQK